MRNETKLSHAALLFCQWFPDLVTTKKASIDDEFATENSSIDDDALERLEDELDTGVRMLDDSTESADSSTYVLSLLEKKAKTLPSAFMKLVRQEPWVANIQSK